MPEEIYSKVGPAGVCLILLSAFCLYISIKNILWLFFTGRDFDSFLKDMQKKTAPFHTNSIKISQNPLIDILVEVHKKHTELCRDQHSAIRHDVSWLFLRNFARVHRDMTILKLTSVISPLLGLMGTMLGMVKVFQVLAVEGRGMANPADLASGIWEALLTTILGLAIAIPVLILFYIFNLKLKMLQTKVIESSYKILKIHDKRIILKADALK